MSWGCILALSALTVAAPPAKPHRDSTEWESSTYWRYPNGRKPPGQEGITDLAGGDRCTKRSCCAKLLIKHREMRCLRGDKSRSTP